MGNNWGIVCLILLVEICKVSSCPLELSTIVAAVEAEPTYIQVNKKEISASNDHELSSGKNLPSSSSSSSMFSSVLTKIVWFVVKIFMGEQWLSERVALNRLDELKTSLFKYYARKNLFGASVETARDGIGFPSLEGALLSLAFLTFSVFLIDLIQLILNKLRRRSVNTPAPATTAAGFIGRTFNPAHSTMVYHPNFSNDKINNSNHIHTETLTETVLSAIEKPWNYMS